MENLRRSPLVNLDALAIVAQESAAQAAPRVFAPQRPGLKAILTERLLLPQGALFLGLAEDGLPVLLNLEDPVPGPLLILADPASGKTSFLQMIARALEATHDPSLVQAGVITPRPEEWNHFEGSASVVGVYSVKDQAARELLQSLTDWARNNRDSRQTLLLFIDDLEKAVCLGEEAGQFLRWLLLRGPSRRVWCIATLDANRASGMEAWLEFFRTRLFGKIEDRQAALFASGGSGKAFERLAVSQFTMREGDGWLDFWAPSI
ncbi:MAG: hypothetical protein LDL50_07030 [Chloroflexi bacterium]|nr:hypothetical protein [Chloroflexota bacterium]